MRHFTAAFLLSMLAYVPPALAVQISSYPSAGTLQPTDILPLVRTGTTGGFQTSPAAINSYVQTNIPGTAGQIMFNSAGTLGAEPASSLTIPYSSITGTPSLAPVATTGAYSSLTGLPTLGTAAAASTGTAGAVLGLLNGNNTYSGALTFTSAHTVNRNATALPSPLTGTVIQAGNADATATRYEADAFGATSYFTAKRTDGTNASPLTLAAADEIGGFNAWGFDGTSSVGPFASVRTFANQNWNGSAHGTYLDFATTPNGSSTLTSALRIENDGGIDTTGVTGGDKGAGTINAAGLYVNGTAVGIGGGSTPGGATGSVQFNSGGTLGGATVGAGLSLSSSTLASTQSYFNIKDSAYGAKGDGKVLTDVTTTASSATISSASYTFVSGDTGKLITCSGAGASGAILNTTISSVSSGNAVLASTAGTSISGTVSCTFGTNDTTAIQTAVNAANAAGGGTVFIPKGLFVTNGTVTWYSNISGEGVGAGKSIIKWISTSDQTSAMIAALSGGLNNPYSDIQFKDFEMDDEAATDGTYTVAAKAIYIQWINRFLVDGMYVHGTPATGIGTDFLNGGRIVNNVVKNCGRLAATGSSLGGSGIGVGTSSYWVEGAVISGNIVYSPTTPNGNYGIFFEAQQSTSGQSYNRIANNWIYLGNVYQKGISSAGTNKTVIDGNHITGRVYTGQRGISLDTGTYNATNNGQFINVVGNVIDQADYGIYIDGSNSGQTATLGFNIASNTITGSLDGGIWVHGNASTVLNSLTLTNNTISGNGSAGIEFDGTAGFSDIIINGNTVFNNGTTTGTSAYKSALTISSPISRLTMHGNTFYDNGSGTQYFGTVLNNVAVTNAQVTGNDLQNNATSGISYASTGTMTGILFDNKGAEGTGSILDLSSGVGTARSSLILPGDTTSNRPSAGIPGMIRYNTTTPAIEAFYNSQWNNLSPGTFATAPVVASIRTVTASGTVTVSATTDYFVCINKTTGAATTVNLPASPSTGLSFLIKDCKGDAATNNITLTPASGNIDGSATYVINVNHQSTALTFDGTQWEIN